VDPVGACVGHRGSRIALLQENPSRGFDYRLARSLRRFGAQTGIVSSFLVFSF